MSKRNTTPLEVRIAEYVHAGRFVSMHQMKTDLKYTDDGRIRRSVDRLVAMGSIQRELNHTHRAHYVLKPVEVLGDIEARTLRSLLAECTDAVSAAQTSLLSAQRAVRDLDRRMAEADG